MADEEQLEDGENAEEAALAATVSAAKKKKIILLGGLVVLLLLLAGGGTWLVLHLVSGKKTETVEQPVAAPEKAADTKEAKSDKSKKAPALYDVLEPAFLANYLVAGRQHYLQLSLAVLARDEDTMSALHTHMPLIRNRVVLLLSGETFEGLQTDEGRIQLQQKLLAAIQEILKKESGKPGIEQVFFTNFVMQ